MQDLTSIIIPCYNAEGTITRAVESALEQTHDSIEVIVVDDGSTDNSIERLRSFGSRIEIIRGINRGGGAARNIGLKSARGQFVQFLDADDKLLPEKVARGLDAINQALPNEIPVSDWTRKLLARDAELENYSFVEAPNQELEAVLRQTLTTSAPLHRREALESIGGFREHLQCCQEKDLHIRLFINGFRFRRIPFDGVLQYETIGSVSSDNTKVLLQRKEVFRYAADLLDEIQPEYEWKNPLACALAVDAFDLINLGHVDSYKDNLVLARQLDVDGYHASCIPNKVLRLLAKAFGAIRAAQCYALLKRLS